MRPWLLKAPMWIIHIYAVVLYVFVGPIVVLKEGIPELFREYKSSLAKIRRQREGE